MERIALGFLAGNLASLSPCVMPVLPTLVGSALQDHKRGPLAMAAGMIVSFTTLGIAFSAFTDLLGIEQTTLRSIIAALLILIGVVLLLPSIGTATFGHGLLSRVDRLKIPGWQGQFLVGTLIGAVWAPCTGPVLGSALALAAQEGSRLHSSLIIAAFGVGVATPFLFIAYGSRSFWMKHRSKLSFASKSMKSVLGVTLMVLGALTLSGLDKTIEAVVFDLIPDSVLKFLTTI